MWGFFDTLHHIERQHAMNRVADEISRANSDITHALHEQTSYQIERDHQMPYTPTPSVYDTSSMSLGDILGVVYWTPAFIAGFVCFMALFMVDIDTWLTLAAIVGTITLLLYKALHLLGGALARLFDRQERMTPEQIEAARR